MRLDINELAALFHIHAEASKHGNNFKNIKDAAWEQLKQMDAEHAKDEAEGDPVDLRGEPVPDPGGIERRA